MVPSGVPLPESSTEVGDEAAACGVGWLDPRISFSVDFVDKDHDVPAEPTVLNLMDSSSLDFEFFAKERKVKKDAEAVDYSAEFEFCMCTPGRDPLMSGGSADELFYQGKLLPLQIPPRLGMLEYMAPDAEPARFAEGRNLSPLNSQNHSPGGSPYATPALSPGDSGHLSPTVSAAAMCPDVLSALPSSPGTTSLPPASPFLPVCLPTCYPIAPESPPARLGSCLPSAPFRHSKSFKWKGIFGSFLKLKTDEEGNDEVVNDLDGRQLDRTESKRRFSRRLSFSLRRAASGHEETVGSSDLGSSGSRDIVSSAGIMLQDDKSVPPSASVGSTYCPEDVANLQTIPQVPLSSTRSDDPASASSSRRTCATAQSLDDLIPSDDGNDIPGHLIADVNGAYSPARRAKHSRWIVMSCGLRGSPKFRQTRLCGARSPGSCSPSKLAVKVGDVDCSGNGSAKIVLKNLECVTSPTKGCTKVQEQVSLLKQQRDAGLRSPEKLGSYSASVRVMPVLNVPLCNLAPAFRAAKSSSKGRFPSFRHIFFARREKDATSPGELATPPNGVK